MCSSETDRGDSFQIYHLTLLKPWREVLPVALVTAVPEKEELGSAASVKDAAQVTLVPLGDQLSLSQRAQWRCKGIILMCFLLHPVAQTS